MLQCLSGQPPPEASGGQLRCHSPFLLLEASLNTLVFPASRVYDEQRSLEPNYPSTRPSIADFIPEENWDELHIEQADATIAPVGRTIAELRHAPPRLVISVSCYLRVDPKSNIRNHIEVLVMLVLRTTFRRRFLPLRASLGGKGLQTSSVTVFSKNTFRILL